MNLISFIFRVPSFARLSWRKQSLNLAPLKTISFCNNLKGCGRGFVLGSLSGGVVHRHLVSGSWLRILSRSYEISVLDVYLSNYVVDMIPFPVAWERVVLADMCTTLFIPVAFP